jgi:cytochrome b pre-mRNA-processing protein 3
MVRLTAPLTSLFSTNTTTLPPILPDPSPPAPLEEKPSTGLLQRLWDRYSVPGQQRRIQMAESLFEAATFQASDPRWYGPAGIGREFRPRHALLTLHLWFLHKRLAADEFDKETALMIQEELFNILWEDTTCRIRQQGVNELAVNKNLMKVQQYTFLHLTHYDHAYSAFLDKPEERLKELRKIVWMHIFVRDAQVERRTDQLDRIAWYIEANYQNIMMDWPDEYYRHARVKWVDLPDFSNLKDASGKIMEETPVHADDVLPHPWRRNITLKGTFYYWNPETMLSSWERPTE